MMRRAIVLGAGVLAMVAACAPQSAGDPLSVGSPEQRIELVDLARDLGRLCSLPPRTVVIGHLELRTTITGTSVVLASSAPFEVATP